MGVEKTEKKKSEYSSIYLFMGVLFVAMLLFTGEQRIADIRKQMLSVQAEEQQKAAEKEKKRLASLSKHEKKSVPHFYQWDSRWKNQRYARGNIGSSGCGPTCLSMVAVYLLGDDDFTPSWMATYSTQNGYIYGGGTAWKMMDEGARRLGISVKQIRANEKEMKKHLDKERVMICSMRPGDFTRCGHFIVISGYDEDGFIVNDPNSKANSEKRWKFSRIKGQIKNTWVYWM